MAEKKEMHIDNINKLSMIIGEFKANQSVIDKCMNFKFAYAPETIIANLVMKKLGLI